MAVPPESTHRAIETRRRDMAAALASQVAEAAGRPGAARTLLLDLDGTLAPIALTPAEARVPLRTLELLERLVELGWSIAVVSGRPAVQVRSMVPLPRVRVFGSHGIEGLDEEAIPRASPTHALRLAALAEEAPSIAAGIPGALVEIKPDGIAFHERAVASGSLATWRGRVREFLARSDLEGLEVLRGRRVVEIRRRGAHKGLVLRAILAGGGWPEVDGSLVAFGDDRTDADLFRSLEGKGISVFVGRNRRRSRARRRLASPASVQRFLESLARLSPRPVPRAEGGAPPLEPFLVRSREAFRFMDYEGLVMPTGLRAINLRELLDLVRRVPLEVIRHHLHRTPLSHRYGEWDYPNDFAQWAAHSLEDIALAEKLAALDPYAHRDVGVARTAIADIIEEHLDGLPIVPWARPGFELHLASGRFTALPGEREIWTLAELRAALNEVPLSSIFYHFHEARLREPGDDSDDFSRWIEGQFGPHPIARALRGIDFYFYSLDELRRKIVSVFDEHRGGVAP